MGAFVKGLKSWMGLAFAPVAVRRLERLPLRQLSGGTI
jgi:hypothetical protein